MACIEELKKDTGANAWIGRTKNNETRTFLTLNDYDDYVNALAKQGVMCSDSEAKVAQANSGNYTPYTKNIRMETGFLEFAPKDPVTQAKYDAMSDAWQGSDASKKAVNDGLFKDSSRESKSGSASSEGAPQKQKSLDPREDQDAEPEKKPETSWWEKNLTSLGGGFSSLFG